MQNYYYIRYTNVWYLKQCISRYEWIYVRKRGLALGSSYDQLTFSDISASKLLIYLWPEQTAPSVSQKAPPPSRYRNSLEMLRYIHIQHFWKRRWDNACNGLKWLPINDLHQVFVGNDLNVKNLAISHCPSQLQIRRCEQVFKVNLLWAKPIVFAKSMFIYLHGGKWEFWHHTFEYTHSRMRCIYAIS